MREASVGHQCPECVAEGRRTQRPARTAFGGGAAGQLGYVTKTLIALNVIMMVASIISARGGDAAFGGGWGGLLGGDTPLTDWGSVLGYAVVRPAARACTGSPPASTTACSPRCSCTTGSSTWC